MSDRDEKMLESRKWMLNALMVAVLVLGAAALVVWAGRW